MIGFDWTWRDSIRFSTIDGTTNTTPMNRKIDTVSRDRGHWTDKIKRSVVKSPGTYRACNRASIHQYISRLLSPFRYNTALVYPVYYHSTVVSAKVNKVTPTLNHLLTQVGSLCISYPRLTSGSQQPDKKEPISKQFTTHTPTHTHTYSPTRPQVRRTESGVRTVRIRQCMDWFWSFIRIQ